MGLTAKIINAIKKYIGFTDWTKFIATAQIVIKNKSHRS